MAVDASPPRIRLLKVRSLFNDSKRPILEHNYQAHKQFHILPVFMSFYSVSSEHKNSGSGHNPLQNGVEHNDALPNEVERTGDVSTYIRIMHYDTPSNVRIYSRFRILQ